MLKGTTRHSRSRVIRVICKNGTTSRRLHLWPVGPCLQRFVFRHRWYGKRHNLLLAPVAERDQKLPYCLPHHWARHRHRNLPLRANLNSWVDPFEVKNSHAELDAAAMYKRDYEYDYFGFKTFWKSRTFCVCMVRLSSDHSICSYVWRVVSIQGCESGN